MHLKRFLYLFTASLILMLVTLSCSGKGNSPVVPDNNPDSQPDWLAQSFDTPEGYELDGFYTLMIDPETLEAEVTPDRHPTAHMNVTGMLIPTFHVNSLADRVYDVDVTLCNTYPLTGYDLRIILFTDNKGVELRNPDDWTPLFDIPGGTYINPFKAFAKDEPNRAFGQTCHTEKFMVYFPQNPYAVKIGIDVCYPTNAAEPYSIENFQQDILFDEAGSSADVTIDVFDWQNDVNNVVLQLPSVTGAPFTFFTHNENEVWSATLTNTMGVVPGLYKGLVLATSANSGNLPLYDYIDVEVTAKALFVFEIEGEYTVRELNCTEYSVEALGDTGITYNWTVDPPALGTFTDPAVNPAEFCAGEVTEDTVVKIYVEVNSDSYGPIYREKTVTILNGLGWPNTWGGTGDDRGYATAVDSEGNVYVAGQFTGTVDFDPGDDEWIRIAIGGTDAYVSKFNSSGNHIWTQTFGTSTNNAVNAIATDAFGCVYICGTTYIDSQRTYAFIIKYLSSGQESWAYTNWTSPRQIRPSQIVSDQNGYIYVCGDLYDEADLDPTSGVDYYHCVDGRWDPFVVKLDLDGNYYWYATRTDRGLNSRLQKAVIDNSGNIFIAGWDNRYDDKDWTDAFLTKFLSDGSLGFDLVWSYPDRRFNEASSLVIDHEENIYVTGKFSGTTNFNPDPIDPPSVKTAIGSFDVYLSKFNPAGDFLWVKTFGGSDDDLGLELLLTPEDKPCIFGVFKGTVDFDPSINAAYRTSHGGYDFFLNEFDSDGNFQKVITWGESIDDITFPSGIYTLTGSWFSYKSQYFYLTNYFSGTRDFDPDPEEVEERTSLGGNDAYVTKMDLDGNLVRD